MLDAEKLGTWCLKAVESAGLQPTNHLIDSFLTTDSGNGITVIVLLAGSHICIHAWPAQKAASVDVYVCGPNAAKTQALMQALADRFAPEWTEQRSLDRGDES